MGTILTVGGVAERLGVPPRIISRLFYDGELNTLKVQQVAGGMRLIPEEYVPMIAMVLRRKGKLPRPRPVDQASEVGA